ncbi:MAG TPA: transcriptional regulator, partial [Thermoanaerobaculia bacterium]
RPAGEVTHLMRLFRHYLSEEAGYVVCDKRFEGRVPKTEYRLAAPGRRALERYLDHMEAIIHATRVS